jgi:hypothetical protein
VHVCREAEELARIPYEDEILLCDQLALYLQSMLPASETTKEEQLSTPTLQVEGMVLFQRSENEFLQLGNNKKRGKKKSGSNAKKDVIVHGVDTIKSFSLLQITPPSASVDVAKTIESLKDKKVYFQGLERGAVPSIASQHKASREGKDDGVTTATDDQTVKTGKAVKSVFNLDADFPGLSIGGDQITNPNIEV